jgi:hypothetical protein
LNGGELKVYVLMMLFLLCTGTWLVRLFVGSLCSSRGSRRGRILTTTSTWGQTFGTTWSAAFFSRALVFPLSISLGFLCLWSCNWVGGICELHVALFSEWGVCTRAEWPIVPCKIRAIHIVDNHNCCWPWVTGGLWYLALVVMNVWFWRVAEYHWVM